MNDDITRNESPQDERPSPPTPPRPPVPEPPRPEETAPPVATPQPTYAAHAVASEGPSPVLAVVLSIVPSLGHLYLGAYQRAVVIVGVLALNFYLPLPLGFKIFIPFFVWFYGMFDAHRLAQQMQLGGVGEAAPASTHGFQGTLTLGIFLTVVGAVILIDNLYSLYWLRRVLRDWWPAILVGIGLYLIAAAVWERTRQTTGDGDADELEGYDREL